MVENWDNTNGLPQNAVFAMEKDNHGYFWVATEEGLTRLDGYSAKVFDQANYPQMQEQTYFTFYKSKAGIWATADRSIALLEKNIRKIIDCTSITNDTWIRAVTEIEGDKLLIGTDAGEIHQWDDGTFTKLEIWKPEIPLEIYSFFQIDSYKLLVGTTRGLYELNLKANTKKLISADSLGVYKIFGTSKDIYIFSPEEGIFIMNKGYEMENIIPSSQIKDINLSSLIVDSDKRIWAGSLEQGLMVISQGQVTRFSYPELKNYTVRKIIKEDNNLFLGTLGKGLLIIKPASVNQPNHEELRNKNIKAIYQSEDGSIWIGTKANGLHQIEGDKVKIWTQKDGLIQDGNTSLASRNGKLYYSSNSGISIIDIQRGEIIGQITEENGLSSNYVHALFNDSNNRLWILTRKGGIHYLDEKENINRVKLPKQFDATKFVSALELKNGQLIIGSMNEGIFRLKDSVFVENKRLPLAPGEDVIYSMYEDAENDLWFGTHGGLVLLKGDQIKILGKINGLKSKTVYSITDDGQHGIWISNNFGVQYFSYSEIKKFKESENDDVLISSTLFDERLGLPNSETNGLIFPSAIQDNTGKIWIPTVEGVGIINPETISDNPKSSINFYWDELRIGEQKSDIQKEIKIPEGVRMFQISFNLIDFENPSQYSLFYRIDNENDNWLPIKNQRQLFFNGLKPGDYTLEIKVLRYGEEDQVFSLPIKVSASFFETLTFKIIIGIVAILLLYFILQSYFNKRLKRNLEEKVTQRTLDLSQANEKLKNALEEIENQNRIMKQLTWNHSHLLRAPLTRAMGINHLLINYSKYEGIEKSKEELEKELLESLKQVDEIIKDTHTKSENLTK
ncbi:hypothetical protein GYM62_04585 [Algoriphagus sp. NBT04N3]|uniref:ligand-binding sensor domain-containing protein n=1 Tax=Algoriphagus sp. NBT04N3 TaxID=2705473 RepID=UPI001C631703|nr:two-component regulator propeller domain-containing protein [Algoriphagus sp. NBT04N3]QYH38109.1 hypothetical protein GYM62_04585 [Algoriphagus sp. NBT04N3]